MCTGRGYNQIKDELPESIQVACHNAADSCTLSGPTEDMEKYIAHLQEKEIFAKLVNVSNIAYHSKYIAPAAPALLNYLKEVSYMSILNNLFCSINTTIVINTIVRLV